MHPSDGGWIVIQQELALPGTRRASARGMSLPYPYEVETGALKPRPPAPRTPLDVAAHVDDAIRVQGGALEVFGVPMDVAGPDSARTS